MRFYVLGTNSELCAAEFFAVYPSAKAIITSESVLVCDETGPDPAEAVNRLAGVVKAGTITDPSIPPLSKGRIATTGYLPLGKGEYEGVCVVILASLDLSRTGKVEFGLSLYDGGNAPLFGTLKGEINKVGMTVKRALEAQGRKVRVVAMKGDALSSVAVTTQAKAGDIALIATKDGVLVGRTQAVQDFEAWSKRDFGRPSRDSYSGMLPPKLARTLVNLAAPSDPSGLSLLDPFCGSGTILMEAALMGFKAVIGSDISKKAVADTGRNMEWVRKEFPEARQSRVSVYVCDAAKLQSCLPLGKGEHEGVVDAIATETFLGSPLRREASSEQARKSVSDLMKTYEPSLAAMKSVLKPGGRIAMAFPAFRMGKALVQVPIGELAKKTGLELVSRFLYERKGQRVARDIAIMRRP